MHLLHMRHMLTRAQTPSSLDPSHGHGLSQLKVKIIKKKNIIFHFSDYWQVDEHRREFLRHRRDPRTRLHDVRKSKIPLPLENLKPEKETHTGVQERWQEGILQGSLET